MKNFFKNKNILITGAGQGIGLHLAKILQQMDANLTLIDIDKERLESAASKCLSLHNNIVNKYIADVTDNKQMILVTEKILKHSKFIDIVIANAGMGKPNMADNFSQDLDKRTMNLNYFGQLNTFLPFIEIMKSRKQGQLVGISSIAAFRGLPGLSSYSASKAAQTTLLESFRVDLKKYGISVSSIHPGYVKTELLDSCSFEMPFMITPLAAATFITKAIYKKQKCAIFPLPMKIQSYITRLLPNFIYDWILPKVFKSS